MPKMDARFAEIIVRKWQDIKAQAFGPDHHLEKLEEVKFEVYIFEICSLQ